MNGLNRKGAIELSMNFIVVIVISIVIFAGGLGIFFKMTKNAKQTVETLDSQTEANIKNMMLSNNYRTAVYPQDAVLPGNDAKMFGIGITNIYDYESKFKVSLGSVTYYETASSTGDIKTSPSILDTYHIITTSGEITIAPHDQAVKEIMLKMPKNAPKGQYVYTIKIMNDTTDYGTLQVYITNK